MLLHAITLTPYINIAYLAPDFHREAFDDE